MFHRQLLALKDLVSVEVQEEYLQNCDRLSHKDPVAFQYICKLLRDVAAQDLFPEELLCLWLNCLQQFVGQEGRLQNLPETVRRGSFWVNLGLLQVQTWIPQTQFDPAVKCEYKLKYAKEEVCA